MDEKEVDRWALCFAVEIADNTPEFISFLQKVRQIVFMILIFKVVAIWRERT